MQLIDLSRELYHRTQVHPAHPPVIVTTWNDHDQVRVAGTTRFSSKALAISLSDHSGTHVDAFCHFDPSPEARSIDQMPLEDFYTEAICLDLSHVPLKHSITVAEMEAAVEQSGQTIKPGDTVLIYMGVTERLLGTPEYGHDFPGLAVEAVHWLADKGIKMFGVEAVSPASTRSPSTRTSATSTGVSSSSRAGRSSTSTSTAVSRPTFVLATSTSACVTRSNPPA